MKITVKPSAFTYNQLSELYEQVERQINRKAENWLWVINGLIEAAIVFIGFELGSYIMRAYEGDPHRTFYAAATDLATVIVLLAYILYYKGLLIKLFDKKYTTRNKYDVTAFHEYMQHLKAAEQIQQQLNATDYAKITFYNNNVLLTTGSIHVSSTVPYNFGTYTKRVITEEGLDFSVIDNDIQSMLETIEKENNHD